MIIGTITAPREAESEIRAAGFTILNMCSVEHQKACDSCAIASGCMASVCFTVEGPRSVLEVIDEYWDEWVWSLEEVNRRG